MAPLPADPVRAVEVRLIEVILAESPVASRLSPGMRLAWSCYLVITHAWVGARRPWLLVELATALGHIYRGRRQRLDLSGVPPTRLVSAQFRMLSRCEVEQQPWRRARCYAVMPTTDTYELDPADVAPLLRLDLAA